jgi:hypothetical protein
MPSSFTLPLAWLLKSTNIGISSAHGPHQEPQTLTISGPRNDSTEIFSEPVKQLSKVSPGFAATWLTSAQSTTSPLVAAG